MEARNRLECAICFEKYRQPCLLKCYHSFCKECIEAVTSSGTAKCPMCNSLTNSDYIKPNYALIEALQEVHDLEHRLEKQCASSQDSWQGLWLPDIKKCGLCTKGTVAFQCVDCDEWMCVDCRQVHSKLKVTKEHIVKTLQDANNGMKHSLIEQIVIIKETIEKHSKHASRWKTEISSVQETQRKTLQYAAELRKKYIADVNARFNEIDSQIKEICTEQIKEMQGYSVVVDIRIDTLQRNLAEIENVMTNYCDDLAVLGNAILAEAKQLATLPFIDCHMAESFSLEVAQWPKWKFDGNIVIKRSGGEIKKEKPGPSTPVLSGLLDRQRKQQKSVELPTVPMSLRLIDGQLWQCQGGGISVFTLDLEPVRVIPSRDMGCIWDVASTGPEEVVVAAGKGLYCLNKDGNVMNRVAEDVFSSVCLHEDQLYAAQSGSHTVCVYRRSGSTWTESSRFSEDEDYLEWGRVTLSVNSAGVYMCVSEQHNFYHYSHSGELLSSTGSEGSGIDGVYYPCLCSVDSVGTALIVDCGNHRLMLLSSSSGTCSVIDLQPPVEQPQCALFCNDRLYVGSYSDNRLTMYI